MLWLRRLAAAAAQGRKFRDPAESREGLVGCYGCVVGWRRRPRGGNSVIRPNPARGWSVVMVASSGGGGGGPGEEIP